MIATFAFLAYATIVIALAEQCAKWDNEEIDYRVANGGESLEHGPMWRFRAGFVGSLALAAFLLTDLPLLPLLGIGAFGFSAWFRYRLNRLRGKDWRYIAPWSNVYDRVFWAIEFVLSINMLNAIRNGKWRMVPKFLLDDGQVRLVRYGYEAYGDPEDKQPLHRAGTIAYITEITITAACIVWVGITLIP